MRGVLETRMSRDAAELVLMHAACATLQKSWRRALFAHARRPEWPALRRHVSRRLRPCEFDVLQRNALVRREWRHECDSWFASESDCRVIHDEVTAGLWVAPSHGAGTPFAAARGRGTP